MPSPPPRSDNRLFRVRRSDSRAEGAWTSALHTGSQAYALRLAARVLAQVYAGCSLSEALELLAGESPVARAGAQDVVYGVLRGGGRGEFFIGRLMAWPLSHPEAQTLLLAAIYRLETRPDAEPMVVDQAVKAASELANGAFKGVVNGVLRNFLRQRGHLLDELRQDEPAYFQHPAWWLERLRRAYREDWPRIVAAGNRPPPMTLRVNTRRISVAAYLESLRAGGIEARRVAGSAEAGNAGIRLATPVPVDRLPGFAEGQVSVQDAGAQRAAALLDPRDGARVLDACAAPGGKTAHLLERAALDLLALDIDAARARRVTENLDRLGLTAEVRAVDCLLVDRWWDGRPFDAILADAPCSASGVARRYPDIKTLRRESDIRKFARAQSAILDALWPLLKPGGKLLYATCSVFVEENGAQTDAFLARWADARRVTQEQWLPCDENDGFYYALLEKA